MKFRLLALAITMGLVGCMGHSRRPDISAVSSVKQTVHHYVYFGRERERIADDAFLSTQQLEGAQLVYAWKELEPGEDEYDFSEIQKDLVFLQAKGKKLFVQLQDATFDAQFKAVPKYLLKPKYNGGVACQCDDSGTPQGYVSRRWDPLVQDRFQKLMFAMGREFDGKVEGVNLQETAIDVVEGASWTPAGFKYIAYRDAVMSNMSALKRAFPHSIAMQYANFMPGETADHALLRSIYQYGEKFGVGLGAPDLMPDRPGQRENAYKMMHETQYTVPIGIAVQDGNYTGTTGNEPEPSGSTKNIVPDLASFAQDYLKVTHIFWGAQEPHFSRDVVPFVRAIQ